MKTPKRPTKGKTSKAAEKATTTQTPGNDYRGKKGGSPSWDDLISACDGYNLDPSKIDDKALQRLAKEVRQSGDYAVVRLIAIGGRYDHYRNLPNEEQKANTETWARRIALSGGYIRLARRMYEAVKDNDGKIPEDWYGLGPFRIREKLSGKDKPAQTPEQVLVAIADRTDKAIDKVATKDIRPAVAAARADVLAANKALRSAIDGTVPTRQDVISMIEDSGIDDAVEAAAETMSDTELDEFVEVAKETWVSKGLEILGAIEDVYGRRKVEQEKEMDTTTSTGDNGVDDQAQASAEPMADESEAPVTQAEPEPNDTPEAADNDQTPTTGGNQGSEGTGDEGSGDNVCDSLFDQLDGLDDVSKAMEILRVHGADGTTAKKVTSKMDGTLTVKQVASLLRKGGAIRVGTHRPVTWGHPDQIGQPDASEDAA